jgi:hypothetical protein
VVFIVSHKLVSIVVDKSALPFVSVRTAPTPENNPDTSKLAFVQPPERFTAFVMTVELVKPTPAGTVTRFCAKANRINDCALADNAASKRNDRMRIPAIFCLTETEAFTGLHIVNFLSFLVFWLALAFDDFNYHKAFCHSSMFNFPLERIVELS